MSPVSFAVLIIALVSVFGLLLGSIRVRRVGLGAAGVLFAGIVLGHITHRFDVAIDSETLHFTKELGLILFVFTLGIELGPGMVKLWRRQGLSLNAMAAAVVLLGFGVAILSGRLLGQSALATAGLFCGATTNTPALGAAEQSAVLNAPQQEIGIDAIAAAYAVTYPGAVLGIIGAILLLRRIFQVDIAAEAKQLRDRDRVTQEAIVRASIFVDNTHLDGIAFGKIPGAEETGVRISRIVPKGESCVDSATDDTLIHVGDVIQVVGTQSQIDRFIPVVGLESELDLMHLSGDVEFRRIHVTSSRVLGQPLRQLALDHMYNSTVTRVVRAGVEMPARGSTKMQYGDVVHVVGHAESLLRVERLLGNSVKSLQKTPFLPLFAGIALGVLLGSIPFAVPGVPFPVRLGLAGGPLVVAILLSMVGSIGKLIWYIPSSANHAMRELGMVLFLACAGLGAGKSFFQLALSVQGIQWMIAGLFVTLVPLVVVGLIARVVMKENFCTIAGVFAGSMTDPPALAFANSLSDADDCSAAYATVYPLTMMLRIIAVQGIVFLA